jgi:hypothetical protein
MPQLLQQIKQKKQNHNKDNNLVVLVVEEQMYQDQQHLQLSLQNKKELKVS